MFKFITNLFKAQEPVLKRGRKVNSGKIPYRQLAIGESFIIRNRKVPSGGMLTKLAKEGYRYSTHRMKSGIKLTRVA